MNKFFLKISFLLIIIFNISGCKSSEITPSATTSQPIETTTQTTETTNSPSAQNENTEDFKAPDFTLETMDGRTITLSDYIGKKYVVLNFWATWCGYCVDEFPYFDTIEDEYKSKDVEFLMINLTEGGETKERAQKFLEENNFEFDNVLLDIKSKAADLYEVTGIPATYFIDKNGDLVYGGSGQMDDVMLKSVLDSIITE